MIMDDESFAFDWYYKYAKTDRKARSPSLEDLDEFIEKTSLDNSVYAEITEKELHHLRGRFHANVFIQKDKKIIFYDGLKSDAEQIIVNEFIGSPTYDIYPIGWTEAKAILNKFFLANLDKLPVSWNINYKSLLINKLNYSFDIFSSNDTIFSSEIQHLEVKISKHSLVKTITDVLFSNKWYSLIEYKKALMKNFESSYEIYDILRFYLPIDPIQICFINLNNAILKLISNVGSFIYNSLGIPTVQVFKKVVYFFPDELTNEVLTRAETKNLYYEQLLKFDTLLKLFTHYKDNLQNKKYYNYDWWQAEYYFNFLGRMDVYSNNPAQRCLTEDIYTFFGMAKPTRFFDLINTNLLRFPILEFENYFDFEKSWYWSSVGFDGDSVQKLSVETMRQMPRNVETIYLGKKYSTTWVDLIADTVFYNVNVSTFFSYLAYTFLIFTSLIILIVLGLSDVKLNSQETFSKTYSRKFFSVLGLSTGLCYGFYLAFTESKFFPICFLLIYILFVIFLLTNLKLNLQNKNILIYPNLIISLGLPFSFTKINIFLYWTSDLFKLIKNFYTCDPISLVFFGHSGNCPFVCSQQIYLSFFLVFYWTIMYNISLYTIHAGLCEAEPTLIKYWKLYMLDQVEVEIEEGLETYKSRQYNKVSIFSTNTTEHLIEKGFSEPKAESGLDIDFSISEDYEAVTYKEFTVLMHRVQNPHLWSSIFVIGASDRLRSISPVNAQHNIDLYNKEYNTNFTYKSYLEFLNTANR